MTWVVQGNIRGPVGPQGPAGADGIDGAPGPEGQQGPQGDPGPQGIQGPNGIQGPAGAQGEMGPPGPAGTGIVVKGSATWTAIQATPSPAIGDLWVLTADDATAPGFGDNPNGLAGDGMVWNGTSWTNAGPIQGPEGPQGPAGADGADGAPGAQGPQGIQGIQGEQGPEGPAGPEGPEGPQGPQGIPGEGSDVVVAPDPPVAPETGDLWFDTDAECAGGGGGGGTLVAEEIAYGVGSHSIWTTRPDNLVAISVWAVGPGGGGGSGRRGAAGTSRGGGAGGGAGGVLTIDMVPASWFPSGAFSIVVPDGGIGGAAQTVDDSNGIAGASGEGFAIGASLWVAGGVGGGGGLTSNVSGAISGRSWPQAVSGGGGQGSSSGSGGTASPPTNTAALPTGGGGGGGVTSADASTAGGGVPARDAIGSGAPASAPASGINLAAMPSVPTLSGPSASDRTGPTPASPLDRMGGSGGGGTPGRTSAAYLTAAGNGGRGSGGGGGGGSVNGLPSAAGGNGGPAHVILTFWTMEPA